MNSCAKLVLFSTLILLTVFSSTHAGEVTIPNTFAADTPAVAAEVNANFSAVKTAVDDNDSRVAAIETALAALQATVADQAVTISDLNDTINALQTTVSSQTDRIKTLEGSVSSQAGTITALQSDLAALQASQVMGLEPYLTVDEISDSRGPLVQLAGVNLQIVNGEGATDTMNGLGNLIVGYDEVYSGEDYVQCSDGAYVDEANCLAAEATWGNSFKSGSHYLVLGTLNSYSQYGGLVAGIRNFSTRGLASVTGGGGNSARGSISTIHGGARGVASGAYSTIHGGVWGTASGDYSSINGGYSNSATGNYSSAGGGSYNTAAGISSSVSGGNMRSVSGTYDWRAGTYFQEE